VSEEPGLPSIATKLAPRDGAGAGRGTRPAPLPLPLEPWARHAASEEALLEAQRAFGTCSFTALV
jgi:hypothetical protein